MLKLTPSWPPARVEGGSEEHFRTPFPHHRDHRHLNSEKLVLEQHSITLGLLTPSGNHAEVCFRTTLHHFCLILVIAATCQSLFWNNAPSLWADFGDHRNMPKSDLEQHSITFGSFWSGLAGGGRRPPPLCGGGRRPPPLCWP